MRSWLRKKLFNFLYPELECYLGDYSTRLFRIEENTRNNNSNIEALNQMLESPYELIDYGEFENHFRGSRELIKKRQAEYLPYFKGKSHVLDLGCGRGEFLELMQENHIPSEGVDLYEPFVEECNNRGLKVCHGDAIEYLKKSNNVDGIFAGQIAEHLSTRHLIELCRSAYEKLLDGGCFILETPNPMSLAIFTHAFYIDPSHNKPIHPLTVQYYLSMVGFKDISIIFTEASKLDTTIPDLQDDGIENLKEFNESMQEIEKLLFGSQDYAIIAKK